MIEINKAQLKRMLEAVTDQVNDERETAERDGIEYSDEKVWPDQVEQTTERGFLLARVEEFLADILRVADAELCATVKVVK